MSVDTTQSLKLPLVPERHLLLAWILSLVAFTLYGRYGLMVDVVDSLLVVVAHLVCFPLLSPRLNPTVVPSMGLAVLGLATGCELVDLCFDSLICWDTSLTIGDRVFSAKEVGFLYYKTMLKGRHVNFAVEIFLLTSQFGALVGLSRSPPKVWRNWLGMVVTMVSGNGFYLTAVVPRYVDLRLATDFEEHFFDGWSKVSAARLFLLVHLLIAITLLTVILVKMKATKSHEK